MFAIVYDNTTVRYYRNGELLRSVAKAGGLTYSLDSSFAVMGAAATDVAFHALPVVSAGATSAFGYGFAANLPSAVKAGWQATALLLGGGAQLVTLTLARPSDNGGLVSIVFEPALRKGAYALITDRPFAEMERTGALTGWEVGALSLIHI